MYRHDVDLILLEPTDNGPLKFAVTSSSAGAHFAFALFDSDGAPSYIIKATDTSNATINYRSRSMSLREFFEEEPPIVWFADGSSLAGNEYLALRKLPEPFPRVRIEAWDWTGTRIRVESQGIERNPRVNSIPRDRRDEKTGGSVWSSTTMTMESQRTLLASLRETITSRSNSGIASSRWLMSRVHASRNSTSYVGRRKKAFAGWRSQGTFSRT